MTDRKSPFGLTGEEAVRCRRGPVRWSHEVEDPDTGEILLIGCTNIDCGCGEFRPMV